VCYNREELDAQFTEALSFSATKNAMIEDYITGRDFLLNYIAQDGEFRLISMFDRYVCSDRGSAINYSNIGKAPSKAIDYYLAEVNPKVVNMFKSLGFRDGLYFMQGYSDGNKITFFEMGCRLGGSYYNLENKCIDCDTIDMTIRYALTGKMTDNIFKYGVDVAKYDKIAITVNYLLKGKEETIGKITGIEEIKKMKSFVECEQRQFEGDHYKNERIVDRPVFSVYLVDDNMDEVRKDINYMNSVFEVLNVEGQSILTEKFDPDLLQ
jgi:biotin carboxylase